MRGLHYIATPALDKAAPWWLPPPLTVLHLWSLYPISQIYFSDSLIQDINFKIPKQVHRSIIAWTHEINLPGDVEWQTVMVYKTWRSWLKRWSQHLILSHFGRSVCVDPPSTSLKAVLSVVPSALIICQTTASCPRPHKSKHQSQPPPCAQE